MVSPAPLRVVRVELSVHAHATEDVGRVRSALLGLIPESVRGRALVSEQVLEGHHGNPIVRITVRLEGRAAEEFIRHLGGLLEPAEKQVLRSLLESRYDQRSGRLYLRLSKQDAYMGRVRVVEGDDVIHIMVNLRGTPRLERAVRVLEELGLLS